MVMGKLGVEDEDAVVGQDADSAVDKPLHLSRGLNYNFEVCLEFFFIILISGICVTRICVTHP